MVVKRKVARNSAAKKRASRQSTASETTKDKSLESWIWDAACSIRGAKDAPKFKDYILPLIFIKRLCDVFDDELNRIAKEVGSRKKAFLLANDLRVSRLTAAKYLEQLTEKGFIEKHKIGRYNYYVNRPLMNIFMDIPDIPDNENT